MTSDRMTCSRSRPLASARRIGALQGVGRTLHYTITSSLVLCLSACLGTEFPPEPSTDEEGLALISALGHIRAQSDCGDDGLYWPTGESLDAEVYTGLSRGGAGVLQGVLEGAWHLRTAPLSSEVATENDLLPWLETLLLGTQWLEAQGKSQGDEGARAWPTCVDISGGGQNPEGTCATGDFYGLTRLCTVGSTLPTAGLATGTAGVGTYFLSLYERRGLWLGLDLEALGLPPADTSGCTWLSEARAAGLWLLEQECDGAGYWPAAGTECAGARIETGLENGAAGIGTFFLRLWLQTSEARWLDAASRVGAWLQAQQVAYDTEPASASVPAVVGEAAHLTGLNRGNAGVAYFLFLLYEQQLIARSPDTAAQTLSTAQALLTWLQDPEVRKSELGGYAWWESPTQTTQGVTSGLEDGTAGIGWVYLQVAKAQHMSVLDDAKGAGRWLSHALNAHYYQGRVWWPERMEPWEDTSSTPTTETTPTPSVGETTGRTYLYYPGMRRGISGVAWFLLDLSRADGTSCPASLSDQAAHWLYLRGRPQADSGEYWRWPEQVERAISGVETVGPYSSTYDDGTAGIIPFLAMDRGVDLAETLPSRAPVLGLVPLPAPAPGVAAESCGSD